VSEAPLTVFADSNFEHIHIGAGSFGLGMVVDICHGDAGLRTAVVARESSRDYHRILQTKGAFSVLFDSNQDRRRTLKPSFHYYNPDNSQSVIQLLIGAKVSLITTAVRRERLDDVGRVLATALQEREMRGHHEPLCIIACENLPDNSAQLRRQVELHLPQEKAQHLLQEVFFCNTLVDRICAEISHATGSVEIPVESYHSWIVRSPAKEIPILELLAAKQFITLARTDAEFSLFETQKYWCMNGVHLATAAYAYNNFKQLRYVSQALANPDIASKVRALQLELLAAFLKRVSDLGMQEKFSAEMARRYNERVFQRLAQSRKDTIDRILKLEENTSDAVLEILRRIERLVEPQCAIMAHRKGLVNPRYETIALHQISFEANERLELDDALQQVILALRTFATLPLRTSS